MTYHDDGAPSSADFVPLFVGEPAPTDPADDLVRGRRRRRRRGIAGGVVVAAALAAASGGLTLALSAPQSVIAPADRETAVPSPVPSTRVLVPEPVTPPPDTAPALRRDAGGNYLDRNGLSLGGSVFERDPDARPFAATTRNTWKLAARDLDPAGRHLEDYDSFAFTGGGSGGGIQIGQKIGWTVRGEPGQGVVQLAVTRLGPKEKPALGSKEGNAEGYCNDVDGAVCRRTVVDGVEVYLAHTDDGGFVMDRLQADGEIASIAVSPVFANNTDIALRSMKVSTAAAAALLDDSALDVIG